MPTKLLHAAALMVAAFFTIPAANASVVSVFTATPGGGGYAQKGNLAGKANSVNGYYLANWSGTATSVWTANGALGDTLPGSQDATGSSASKGVDNWIHTITGITVGNVQQKDELSGKSGSWTGLAPFHYLALHYGKSESLFYFATAQTAFAIANLTQGLSNWRTYNAPQPRTPTPDREEHEHEDGTDHDDHTRTAVPLPGAIWLFGSALIGLAGMRKRKHSAITQTA